MGLGADPDWDNRLELHIPDGSTYAARNFGTEVIFGKEVHKGIAARVLQYANELMVKAYGGPVAHPVRRDRRHGPGVHGRLAVRELSA